VPWNGKYGRLFTEADVVNLMDKAWEEGRGEGDEESLAEILETTETTIPRDEPWFVIRGKDQLAPTVVRDYATRAEFERCDEDFVRQVNEAADHIEQWQEEHPDRTKVPD
jgi:predicted transcriptional regulator